MTVQLDYNELRYVTDVPVTTYSGRGMYGKSCLALVVDDLGDLITFVCEIAEWCAGSDDTELDDFYRCLGDVSSDNMGLGMVYYWRNIELINYKDEDN